MNLNDEHEFLAHIKTEIESNRLVLPTLPDVALRVRDEVNKQNSSAKQLADLIATDAALSARLIQVANSPIYRGKQEIDNLRNATARLGNNTVRNLVTSLVMKQMFKTKSSLLDDFFHNIWETSVNVAANARALATLCKHLNPDQAMLAGLIHQIGKLPILTLAEKDPGLLEDKEALEKTIQSLHPEIGRIIMDTWTFPDSLKPVVWEYCDLQRTSAAEADYVDVVQVAYIENLSESDMENHPVDLNDIPAFAKLGLAPDIEVMEIDGVAGEVGAIKSLLM